jgi:hypothetical protein
LQALVEPGGDAVLVGIDAGHVDAVQARLDAELLTVAGGIGHLGGVQQGFGRDAPAVQAGSTQFVPLDEDDGQVQLGCAQRRGVSPRPATEDDEISGCGGVLGVGHEIS